ncbi:MAG: hypothetical protein CMO80_22275 [Verrucomicrobiales bacterium]|nr:hypothetical protein [Verrucomicrobiales bacterium]|tara:strand:+ start:45356 stop:50791 length:5436 start_codon:yes stop_codon:yes gene_type:complete
MGFLSKIAKPFTSLLGVIVKPISKLLKSWMQPDMPKKQGLKLQRIGSNKSIPVVYGTRIVGGIVVDKNVVDGALKFDILGIPINLKNGNKNGILSYLVVFCHGEVDAIEEFYFNDIPSTDKRYAKDNGEKWFAIDYRLGGEDNNVAMEGKDLFNKFNVDTSKYEGLCCAIISFEQDKNQSVWRGEPEITARIRGKRCYDWRTDTVGYSENPAVHMVDYAKSEIYSVGLKDEDINYEYFTQVANLCDTEKDGNTVTTSRGYFDEETKQWVELGTVTTVEKFKLFTNNTIIDTDEEVFANLKEMAESFRGYFPEPDGRLAIASEDVAQPVFHFNRNNTVTNITRTQPDTSDFYNRVIVRFPNKLNKYEFDEVFYPADDDPLYQEWLEADNFLKLEHTITVEHCVYTAEALQLAEVAVKASRNGEQIQFSGTLEAAELDVGDVFSIEDEIRGWVAREYRISKVGYREDGLIDITGILHNNTIYPWQSKTYQERIGGTYLGDPTNIDAPENLVFKPDPTLANTGTLTWNHEADAFVRGFRVLITSGDDTVLDANTLSASFVIPLLDAGNYIVSVFAKSTLNTLSPPAVYDMYLDAPVIPSDIILTPSNWSIEAEPTFNSGFIPLGTQFEFDIALASNTEHTPQARARGTNYTATGLLPDTDYRLYARTVNAYGESGWFAKVTKTTQESGLLDPFLDPVKERIDNAQDAIDNLGVVTSDLLAQDVVLSEKIDNIELDADEIKLNVDRIETDLDDFTFRVNMNDYDAEQSELELLTALAQTTASREVLRQRVEEDRRLIDAAVEVDPSNGVVTVRAYKYADELFNQAQLQVDGANARITANVESIGLLDDELKVLSAELALVPGQINAIATSIVSESIAALEPAYSFNFFDNAQGWVAVNGTLTATPNQISLLTGDIENTSLNYEASDNNAFRITIERTGGTGWKGDAIITRSDNTTETFAGIIEDIPQGGEIVRTVDFRGISRYNGTITGVRIVLGETTDDTFTVKSIVIGKPDAATLELENMTARVTKAELDINANSASISQKVNVTDYDANTVTFSNVETTVNGLDSIIDLKATRNEIISNGTVAKANQAGVEINALDGRVTTLASTVTQNQQDNEAEFTAVKSEIDTIEGTVTSRTFDLLTEWDEREETDFSTLFGEIDFTSEKAKELLRDANFADAIFQLKTDVSPQGALAQSITELEAVVIRNGQSIVSNAQQIIQVKSDIEGNTAAISQTALDVSKLEGELAASVTRLDKVELDAEDNAQAVSSVTAKVDNANTGLSAAFTLAQQAKSQSDGNSSSITTIENDVSSLSGDVTAASQLAQSAKTEASGNTSALNSLTNRVTNTEQGVTAANSLAQSAKNEASGNTSAVNELQAKVDNPSTGLSATATIAQQAKTNSNNNHTAITNIQSEINDPDTGLSATATLAQQAKSEASGNTSSVNQLTAKVNNSTTGLSATNTLAQQAKNQANGNTSSISSLTSRVEDNEQFASAQLTLNAQYNSELDELIGRAFLGVDSNGRVTGISINGGPATSTIDLLASKVRFINPDNGQVGLQWSNTLKELTFDGHLNGASGTFTGNLTAAGGTFTGTLLAAGGTFTGELRAAKGTFEGDLQGNTITGASIAGGRVATTHSASESRAILEDDGTYMLWIGEGAKNDANGTFWIKKDGTGYIKGSFFEGGIIESKSATGVNSASVSHKSAGKNVNITVGSSGSAFASTTNAPSSPLGISYYTINYTVKRGNTVLESGKINVTRDVVYEENEFLTTDYYAFSSSLIDTDTNSATYPYTIEIGTLNLSNRNQKCSINTFENILGN